MNHSLSQIKKEVYDTCELEILNLTVESESREYDACKFNLNGLHIISRSSKITPKKVGQFVTFWKRKGNGPIEPYSDTDVIDFYIVNILDQNKLGQFVFPKSVLIDKRIISTKKKEGKRAFRVYPDWDVAISKQAKNTQKWQLNYFYKVDASLDFKQVLQLYKTK